MNQIEEKINQTLNCLEGLGKAEVNPFFYRKLEARMLNEQTPTVERFAFVGNLKLNMAVLLVFMILNLITFFSLNETYEVQTSDRESQIESFTEDYFSGSDDYNYLKSY